MKISGFNEEYILESCIVTTCNGELWKGREVKTGTNVVAKFEKTNNPCKHLLVEYNALKILSNELGFPKLYDKGSNSLGYFIVMECLEENLLQVLPSTIQNLKKVFYFAIQLLERLFTLHSYFLIHRDIKPENIMIKTTPEKRITYLIDFGTCKKYIDSSNAHIPFIQKNIIMGTLLFMSLNSHKGFEQSRRDDLESLLYVLLFIYLGKLPWSELQITNINEIHRSVIAKKENLFSDLSDIHPSFRHFYSYVMSLEFEQKPDYGYLISLFICKY